MLMLAGKREELFSERVPPPPSASAAVLMMMMMMFAEGSQGDDNTSSSELGRARIMIGADIKGKFGGSGSFY